MNPYTGANLREFFEKLSPDYVKEQNENEQNQFDIDYKDFSHKLALGRCSLCNQWLNSFNTGSPCFHWFTYPKGIKKKHFEGFLARPVSFFKLRTYLYWLANSERPLGNINNLTEELSASSYFEATIKYKNLEWSFSLGHTDIEGHQNSQHDFPHYHMQLTRDSFTILKFNDFHIPFTDEDLLILEFEKQAPDIIKINSGQGIGLLEDETLLPLIDEHLSVSESTDLSYINRQSLISAPEGKTFSGELIGQAMEESRRTGEPIGRILSRLVDGSITKTILSPGDGVPGLKKRSGKK